MSHHRFQHQHEPQPLPRPDPPAASPGSFVACPGFLIQAWPAPVLFGLWSLYQAAFAEAQAVARPSLPERDLLGVWN
jgi:hypothetical protein